MRVVKINRDLLSKPWRIAIACFGVVLLATIIIQFVYPNGRVLPLTTIDDVNIGGLSTAAAVKKLDGAYASAKVQLYYKGDVQPQATPSFKDLGYTISNQARVKALNYPWYWRLVPSSILWAHYVAKVPQPTVAKDSKQFESYLDETFGPDCKLDPKNATVEFTAGGLKIVPSQAGGTCDINQLRSVLSNIKVSPHPSAITVSGSRIKPAVSDATAQGLADNLTTRIGSGLPISVAGVTQTIPGDTLLGWLDFSADGNGLAFSINQAKASDWLNQNYGSKLYVKPGVTTITTYDFTETAHTSGVSGQAIDVLATISGLDKYIRGTADSVAVAAQATPPTISYKRTYSPSSTGLAALMQNFAESHPGSYGIKLIELTGQKRHASYRGDTQFTTASTYKLFVAYSSLLRVESGAWNWSDQINDGRNLSQCFDAMISQSDNPCAESLLSKIGYSAITNEAHALGAASTSFMGNDGIKSTANDEALLLGLLYSGQILNNQADRDKWIVDMKNNIYRQGIPAGIPGAVVADKVGFLYALLHDAAIVYSPTGDYVLVILTNDSSWSNIADLSRQLAALQAQ